MTLGGSKLTGTDRDCGPSPAGALDHRVADRRRALQKLAPVRSRGRIGQPVRRARRREFGRDPLAVMLGQPLGGRVMQAGDAFGAAIDAEAARHGGCVGMLLRSRDSHGS